MNISGLADEVAELTERFSRLEGRLKDLEARRQARAAYSKVFGICAKNPEGSDDTCSDASLYIYQRGCRGAACVKANTDYYRAYRESKEA